MALTGYKIQTKQNQAISASEYEDKLPLLSKIKYSWYFAYVYLSIYVRKGGINFNFGW